MQIKRILWATIGGMVAVSVVSSAVAVMSVPEGWYLDVNAGSAAQTDGHLVGKTSSSGLGGNANVGYKFMPFVATELGYTLYPNVSVKDFSGNKAGSIKYYAYDLALKGIIPIAASGLEPFAKVGWAHLVSSATVQNAAVAASINFARASHRASGLLLAVGAAYYFMPEMAVVAQWARIQGSSTTGDENLLSGGVELMFN